jgi:hypothetical protein
LIESFHWSRKNLTSAGHWQTKKKSGLLSHAPLRGEDLTWTNCHGHLALPGLAALTVMAVHPLKRGTPTNPDNAWHRDCFRRSRVALKVHAIGLQHQFAVISFFLQRPFHMGLGWFFAKSRSKMRHLP